MPAQVTESACTSSSRQHVCEDVLVVERDGGRLTFVAVIDGATDKSGRLYDGQTGGRLAAEAVAGVVSSLPSSMDPFRAVEAFTAEVARLSRELGVPELSTTPPTASVAVLSVERRELWRVGDIHMGVRVGQHLTPYSGEKAVDVAAAMARAAYTACLLAGGHGEEDLRRDDPGRRFILPLLEAQGVLANAPIPTPFAYGVIDGRPVPARLVEVLPLPQEACEVILASDGYLSAAPTLQDAEDQLRLSLDRDPLRIGLNRGTKGLRPGATSFDDRTYARVSLPAAGSGGGILQAPEQLLRKFWKD